jgi:hypothetical protein
MPEPGFSERWGGIAGPAAGVAGAIPGSVWSRIGNWLKF